MKQIQKGFTLIELMIVVAIIGILAAVAIPAYQDYIVKAKLSKVVSTLDPVKTALAMYFQEQGGFPATSLAQANDFIGVPGGQVAGATTVVGSSWASLGFGNYPSLPKEVSAMALFSANAAAATTAPNISIILTLTGVKTGTVDGVWVSVSPFLTTSTGTPVNPTSSTSTNLTSADSISGASAISWYYGCNNGTDIKTDAVVKNFFKNGNAVLTCA